MSGAQDGANAMTRGDWSSMASMLIPTLRSGTYIDGKFQDAESGAKFDTLNPATGGFLASVARGGDADIDRAVRSGRRVFRTGTWSRMAPRNRMNVLYRLARLIEENRDTLALLDCLDVGKPIARPLNYDVAQAALTFQFFAECVDKMEGAVTNTDPGALHMVLREPLGVVGCITPWNYPLMMAAWKCAPALAAGNSVVLKPAEQSPLSALMLASLFTEAGGPDGVFNVVPGFGEEAGKALATHMDVDKLSFTGSTDVGRRMFVYAGQSNMKRVSTECGGKSPHIVLDDVADLDAAVSAAIHGVYANQGEVCAAGTRLLVQRGVHDAFVERFVTLAPTLYKAGDPLDPATTLGSLVSREHQQGVLRAIDTARREGARQVLGGLVDSSLAAGAFVAPTLFTDVQPGMQIAREEIFGPVGGLMKFEHLSEAVKIANDSVFGLAAGVWTSDLNNAHALARDLESGMVWVNCYFDSDMTQPWGGYKQSGQGRDKCFETLIAHTQSKSVWINLPTKGAI